MITATVKQRAYLIDLAISGEERQRAWIKSKVTRRHSQTGVPELIEAAFRRYVFRPPSHLRTDCLEADWIQPWSLGTEKYAVTPSGFVQIADEEEAPHELVRFIPGHKRILRCLESIWESPGASLSSVSATSQTTQGYSF